MWSGTKFGKVGVALSGGKDSTSLLHLLSDLRIDLCAISVDEGIKDYRDKSLEKGVKTCLELEINYYTYSFCDEFSISLDEMVKRSGLKPCDVCGILRRSLLNEVSLSLGLSHLCLAHNLDDVSQTILMNVATGNLLKVARLPPHRKVGGMVPRLAPLQIFPEKEAYLYAMLKGFDFHSGECPYAKSDVRNLYREAIHRLEDKNPGLGYGLLRTMWDMKKGRRDLDPTISLCPSCGMPRSDGRALCRRCEILCGLGVQLANGRGERPPR